MGLQLIICVETNKKCNSDFIYIRSTINRFYDVDNANIRITPVYLDGKGKYASGKVKKEVASFKNQYKAAAKNNSSIVIYCFDCDNYDTKTEDLRFLNEARKYCDENGFRFVWFCKDIEDVYLGKQISDNQKKKEAAGFAVKKGIKSIERSSLMEKAFKIHCSNLCLVLDEYLK